MLWTAAPILAVLAAAAILNLVVRSMNRDGTWHPHTTIGGEIRYRRLLPSGEWQYREATTEEQVDAAVDRTF